MQPTPGCSGVVPLVRDSTIPNAERRAAMSGPTVVCRCVVGSPICIARRDIEADAGVIDERERACGVCLDAAIGHARTAHTTQQPRAGMTAVKRAPGWRECTAQSESPDLGCIRRLPDPTPMTFRPRLGLRLIASDATSCLTGAVVLTPKQLRSVRGACGGSRVTHCVRTFAATTAPKPGVFCQTLPMAADVRASAW